MVMCACTCVHCLPVCTVYALVNFNSASLPFPPLPPSPSLSPPLSPLSPVPSLSPPIFPLHHLLSFPSAPSSLPPQGKVSVSSCPTFRGYYPPILSPTLPQHHQGYPCELQTTMGGFITLNLKVVGRCFGQVFLLLPTHPVATCAATKLLDNESG